MTLAINEHLTHDWSGQPVNLPSPLSIRVNTASNMLEVHVEAPLFHNTPPSSTPGSTPELWNHEVVELFILGEDERYLEIELGPHGHYLILQLHGTRQVIKQGMSCAYTTTIKGDSWSGTAHIPTSYLPPNPTHFNLYAIHNTHNQRRYLSLTPTQTKKPDFHNLTSFSLL